jgi:hypothetical protein
LLFFGLLFFGLLRLIFHPHWAWYPGSKSRYRRYHWHTPWHRAPYPWWCEPPSEAGDDKTESEQETE